MQSVILSRAFIASPSDVQAEREAAVRVITEWNAAHSLKEEAIVEAVRIETHAMAALGSHPQELINAQLLDRCDFLVGIFWSKLGTPTNKEPSGTVHEIKEFAERKGPENVMLFFSEEHLPHSIDSQELDRLRDFQKEIQHEGLYRAFKDAADFERVLRQQLDLRLNEMLGSPEAQSLRPKKGVDLPPNVTALLNQETAGNLRAIGLEPHESGGSNLSKEGLQTDLRQVASIFERSWNDEDLVETEHGRRLLRTISRKLLDLKEHYTAALTSGEAQELQTLIDTCNSLSDKITLTGDDFWNAGSDVYRHIQDYCDLLW